MTAFSVVTLGKLVFVAVVCFVVVDFVCVCVCCVCVCVCVCVCCCCGSMYSFSLS